MPFSSFVVFFGKLIEVQRIPILVATLKQSSFQVMIIARTPSSFESFTCLQGQCVRILIRRKDVCIITWLASIYKISFVRGKELVYSIAIMIILYIGIRK